MPSMTRITAAAAQNAQLFAHAQEIDAADYSKVRDAWIGRSGKLFYAGYYGHEESARLLGFDSVESCESAGYVHISSCFNGKISFTYMPMRLSSAQKNTIYDYCTAHTIPMPIEY